MLLTLMGNLNMFGGGGGGSSPASSIFRNDGGDGGAYYKNEQSRINEEAILKAQIEMDDANIISVCKTFLEQCQL